VPYIILEARIFRGWDLLEAMTTEPIIANYGFIGETYGELTIIGDKRQENRGEQNEAKVMCLCSCGNKEDVWLRLLKSGVKTCCGGKKHRPQCISC
jgi:hypothetical protein